MLLTWTRLGCLTNWKTFISLINLFFACSNPPGVVSSLLSLSCLIATGTLFLHVPSKIEYNRWINYKEKGEPLHLLWLILIFSSLTKIIVNKIVNFKSIFYFTSVTFRYTKILSSFYLYIQLQNYHVLILYPLLAQQLEHPTFLHC